MDRCIQQADSVLVALCAQVALLDQVDEVEELIATIRAELQGTDAEAANPRHGAGNPAMTPADQVIQCPTRIAK